MARYFTFLIAFTFLVLVACHDNATEPTPPESVMTSATPIQIPAEATPTPEPTPESTPVFQHDPSSKVAIIGYHRFEEKPHDGLAITPEHFRKQMQTLKDQEIHVIPMEDFLAWKRGEKNIPHKSAVLTIDDGYNDAYTLAWPILKEFNYPFTFYVYINYISKGGRSITWEQLEEMRDAGVDIGSHTVSHASLKSRKGHASDTEYQAFLEKEMKGSKDAIEQKLGVQVRTLAFPYGNYNEQVLKVGKDAGYEALFTVYGKMTGYDSPNMEIGRFIVMSNDKDKVFNMALNFTGGAVAGTTTSTVPASALKTHPASGETISETSPEIRADLSSLGTIDPKSIEMRISGFGIVPAIYNPETKTVSYKVTRRLAENTYAVILSTTADGKKIQNRWEFRISASATPTPSE